MFFRSAEWLWRVGFFLCRHPERLARWSCAGGCGQFVSYEGVFTANNGLAANVLSEDIGIGESSQTAAGMSLQLTGNAIG